MRKLLVPGLVLGGFLVACGGGSGQSDSAPTATVAAAVEATQAPAPTATASASSIPVQQASPAPPVQQTSPTPEPTAAALSSLATDRIVIPSIGVDVPLVAYVVGSEGAMQDPRPNVGVYDLSVFPNVGGRPGEGNLIVAGNIGNNDGPLGSYENFGQLAVGAEISFTLNGQPYSYTVAVRCLARRSDLQPVFNSTSSPALTLMQNLSDEGDAFLGGTQYVIAELNAGTVERACPAGSERP